MIRQPAVAGSFYDLQPNALKKTLEACFLGNLGPKALPTPAAAPARRIKGIVAPHAGYMYSGWAAANAYYELAEDGTPDTAVIIGPSHRASAPPVAIVTEGAWRTPLGDAQINAEIANALLESSDLLTDDRQSHKYEHSLEVQLPFLQYIGGKTKIVPVLVSVYKGEDAIRCAESLGESLAKTLAEKNAVVIASTDLSHYETQKTAEWKDRKAIEAIEAMDYARLLDSVEEFDISMCGAVPTAVAIKACLGLGAKTAELLTYYTSGDVAGDMSEVVGYAALKML